MKEGFKLNFVLVLLLLQNCVQIQIQLRYTTLRYAMLTTNLHSFPVAFPFFFFFFVCALVDGTVRVRMRMRMRMRR